MVTTHIMYTTHPIKGHNVWTDTSKKYIYYSTKRTISETTYTWKTLPAPLCEPTQAFLGRELYMLLRGVLPTLHDNLHGHDHRPKRKSIGGPKKLVATRPLDNTQILAARRHTRRYLTLFVMKCARKR